MIAASNPSIFISLFAPKSILVVRSRISTLLKKCKLIAPSYTKPFSIKWIFLFANKELKQFSIEVFFGFRCYLWSVCVWITPQTKVLHQFKITWYNLPLLGATTCQYTTTNVICQLRGDMQMSFRCDHSLKMFVHGFSLFNFDMALGSASATY